MPTKSNRIIVTVIGADTVGIIANVSAVLAEARANIIDISQTTVREFFAMIMVADLEKSTVPFDELKRRLDAQDAATVQKLYDAKDLDFRVKAGSAAVDRGTPLATVTDGFAGRAPDLGALELGAPLPVYGPRP